MSAVLAILRAARDRNVQDALTILESTMENGTTMGVAMHMAIIAVQEGSLTEEWIDGQAARD